MRGSKHKRTSTHRNTKKQEEEAEQKQFFVFEGKQIFYTVVHKSRFPETSDDLKLSQLLLKLLKNFGNNFVLLSYVLTCVHDLANSQ